MSLKTIFENILKKDTADEIIDEKHREMQSRNNHKALSMAYEHSDLRKFTDFMGKIAELGQKPIVEKSEDEKCPWEKDS